MRFDASRATDRMIPVLEISRFRVSRFGSFGTRRTTARTAVVTVVVVIAAVNQGCRDVIVNS